MFWFGGVLGQPKGAEFPGSLGNPVGLTPRLLNTPQEVLSI